MSCNIFSPGGHCLSPLNEYDTTSDSLIDASDLIDNTRDNTWLIDYSKNAKLWKKFSKTASFEENRGHLQFLQSVGEETNEIFEFQFTDSSMLRQLPAHKYHTVDHSVNMQHGNCICI